MGTCLPHYLLQHLPLEPGPALAPQDPAWWSCFPQPAPPVVPPVWSHPGEDISQVTFISMVQFPHFSILHG